MAADLETFKKLYLQEFGMLLTDKEAERRARSLMQVYVAVYGTPPINQNNDENIITRDESG
jgi:hypothetical protein